MLTNIAMSVAKKEMPNSFWMILVKVQVNKSAGTRSLTLHKAESKEEQNVKNQIRHTRCGNDSLAVYIGMLSKA